MVTIAHAQLSAAYTQLEPIRNFVEKHAVKFGFSTNVIYDLILALIEITTNVIKHGYKEKTGRIEITLCRQGKDFLIIIRDDAPIYNPAAVPDPDLTLPLNRMSLGGLGLYMTKNLVDPLSH